MSERRKDSKGRVLRTGESERKDGLYQFRYEDISGKRQTIYDRDLNELCKKEKEIQKQRQKEEKERLKEEKKLRKEKREQEKRPPLVISFLVVVTGQNYNLTESSKDE